MGPVQTVLVVTGVCLLVCIVGIILRARAQDRKLVKEAWFGKTDEEDE